jgi:hypothetical protein
MSSSVHEEHRPTAVTKSGKRRLAHHRAQPAQWMYPGLASVFEKRPEMSTLNTTGVRLWEGVKEGA